MLYLVALALGALTGITNGGSFFNLASVRIRLAWLALLALILQLVLFTPLRPSMLSPFLPVLHMLSLVGVLAVSVANLRLPGMQLVALGLTLNLAVIAANNGLMPASVDAYLYLGETERARALATFGHVNNVSALSPDTRLPMLADIIPLPFPLPRPSVYSLGDIIIFLGVFTITEEGTKRRSV